MTHSSAWRQMRVGMILADAVAIVATYFVADLLRCRFYMQTAWPEVLPNYGSSLPIHLKIAALLPIAWPLVLNWLGWYEQRWRSWSWRARQAVVASAVTALFMAALALLFERVLYPRAQIGFVCGLLPATAIGVLGISRAVGRWLGTRQPRHVLIVGTGRDAVRLRRLLRSASFTRPRVLGHLRGFWEQDAARIETGAILGDVDRLGPLLEEHVVDEVLFCAPLEHLAQILPLVRLCEEIGVTAHIQAESAACHSAPALEDFHGVPLLTYAPARHSPELLAVKRAMDVVIAVVAILVAAPIMLLCAVLIRLTSPGPILFRQRRSGLNGRTFAMYKFRTMDDRAEERQAELSHLNEAAGPVFKMSRDPRVTQIGRALRRWSLDELPQLFNVVLGDMSIVGPRPPIPAEVERYDRWQRRRLSMRPGLTCLWQIKGRHRIGFEEWMQLDLFYIDHWSLKLDFLIMCRTVTTVLAGTGA